MLRQRNIDNIDTVEEQDEEMTVLNVQFTKKIIIKRKKYVMEMTPPYTLSVMDRTPDWDYLKISVVNFRLEICKTKNFSRKLTAKINLTEELIVRARRIEYLRNLQKNKYNTFRIHPDSFNSCIYSSSEDDSSEEDDNGYLSDNGSEIIDKIIPILLFYNELCKRKLHAATENKRMKGIVELYRHNKKIKKIRKHMIQQQENND